MTIKKAHIYGFIFSSLLGTLLHFVFEWSGGSPIVGALTPVNESTWEHLKMLAIPILIFSVYEYFSYGRELHGFWPTKLLSVLLGMGVITVGYFTYKGIVGRDLMVVNIILFELGILAAYLFSYSSLKSERFSSPSAKSWSVLGIVVLLCIFVIFTFYPPHIGLLIDPQSGFYGIPH